MFGQEHIITALRRASGNGTFHHAYLFVGPAGSGKRAMAEWLAQLANCDSEGERPCGVCSQCHLIAEGSHPDVSRVEPSEKSKKKHILIDQARSIRTEVSRRPVLGRRKVIVMDPADHIEPGATNLLLKTLEEPPAYATLILLAGDTANVLPTVLSRCQVARFKTVPPPDIARWLETEHSADTRVAGQVARLSEGRPGEALRLLQDKEALPKRDRTIAWLEEIAAATPPDALRLSESLRTGGDEEDPDVTDSLRWAGSWFRDISLVQATGDPARLVNADRVDALASAARAYGPGQALAAQEAIVKTRRYLAGNAHPSLALDCLLMDLIPWRHTQ